MRYYQILKILQFKINQLATHDYVTLFDKNYAPTEIIYNFLSAFDSYIHIHRAITYHDAKSLTCRVYRGKYGLATTQLFVLQRIDVT